MCSNGDWQGSPSCEPRASCPESEVQAAADHRSSAARSRSSPSLLASLASLPAGERRQKQQGAKRAQEEGVSETNSCADSELGTQNSQPGLESQDSQLMAVPKTGDPGIPPSPGRAFRTSVRGRKPPLPAFPTDLSGTSTRPHDRVHVSMRKRYGRSQKSSRHKVSTAN